MKMTTEQFLEHLGIEVEQEFRMSETFPDRWYKVDEEYELYYREHDSFEWQKSNLRLCDLLDDQIITAPLPKYTLSEDEKAIVRNLSSKDFDKICVDALKALYVRSKKGSTTWLPFENLFNFIELDTEVSLDELRKCL